MFHMCPEHRCSQVPIDRHTCPHSHRAPVYPNIHKLLFFKKDFIYLFVRESEHKQWERQAEGEADSPRSRELAVGLDPRILGSRLQSKADS